MRSTMYNVPTNQDVKNASEIPLALNATPFADLPPTEVCGIFKEFNLLQLIIPLAI